MDIGTEIEAARALVREGDVSAAVERLERAASTVADPSPLLFEIGNIAKAAGLFDAADTAFRAVLEHRPHSIEAATNLANTLSARGRIQPARTILNNIRSAVTADHPAVDGSLCALLIAENRVEEALACYTELAERHPAHAAAHANRGEMLARLGRHDEALEILQRAAETDPHDARITVNMAFSKLALGRLAEGFRDYEARLSPDLATAAVRRNLRAPRWNGEPALTGPLLVVAEQGLGDEIRFASLLPALARTVSDIVIECDPRLVALFKRSLTGVGAVAHCRHRDGKRAVFDYRHLPFSPGAWIEAGSLPHRLAHLDAGTLCAPGFLRPDKAQVAAFRRRFADRAGDTRLIGLVWGSGNTDPDRARFYPPLEVWTPLLSRPDLTFVDLQYTESREDRARLTALSGARILGVDDVDKRDDLSAAAALAASLDAVVGISSSVTALAGAVGTPGVEVLPERIWVPCFDGRQAWLGAILSAFPDTPADWPSAMARAIGLLDAALERAGRS